jgi:ATP/maltotriose-dependent transcriptional regulator MalT
MLPPAARPLLMAKLLAPPVPRGMVARPRLLALLRDRGDARLTTVVAPAGWGKTTVLAAWAADPAERRLISWLSLDESDDEPTRFWTYALSAIQRVAPRTAKDALAALGGQGLEPVDVALPMLLNALTSTDEEYVLILDDFHVLRDHRVHESVEFLLSYLPRSLHLVISGRADPPLPLARLRARGELNEVRIAELRCTEIEGAAILSAVGDVDGDTARVLVDRTEGWAAGLKLAALTLHSANDPSISAATIGGDERHIVDYFSAEVLAGLDGRQRDLLVRCSVLERLSGPLCDAVLRSSGSTAVLEGLDRRDLFVAALDESRRWYRCHRLFRDVLRRELEVAAPDTDTELLGRAADWFLAEGMVEEAISHRIVGRDNSGALALLASTGRWFLDHGAMASYLRLGEQLAAEMPPDPRQHLALAFAAGLTGQPDKAIRWLQAAEPLISVDPEPVAGWHSLRAAADATWAAYGARIGTGAALRYARRAVELENDPSQWGYVVARQALAGMLLESGCAAEAVSVLRDAWQTPIRRELPLLLSLQGAGALALGLIEVGDRDQAHRVVARETGASDEVEQAWGDGAAAAVAMLRLAEGRLAAADQPMTALPKLDRAVRLAECWGRAPVLVGALLSLAAAQWQAGDAAAAKVSLARARETVDTEEATSYELQTLEALEARVGKRVAAVAVQRGMLVEELTDRELSVLRALAGPLTAREIGAELYLSINTIKGYTKSLYRKLGVVTRADAVHRARTLNLI